uniref:Uncharacterized protein n=1 Tax=Siphoviridae sp. ctv0N24 TaxID=2826509 RepID=A0A8S5N323_9CAUD|nr:MAG TPA: hypothetical protein [Siphoviridae sp. ctv0N24]
MKKSNTTVTEQGIEVYENDIYRLVDEYISTVLQVSPEEFDTQKEYKAAVADSFVDMIFYIADRIPKPSNDDIELLDDIFNIFVRVCSKYNVLPTLEVFSFLVNINRSTFSDWMRGDYRTSSSHGTTAKKWFDICKNCTVNRLNNQPGTNANLIFVAKAAYGMAETAPVQTAQQDGIPHQTAQQIADKHRAALELPEMEKPEL